MTIAENTSLFVDFVNSHLNQVYKARDIVPVLGCGLRITQDFLKTLTEKYPDRVKREKDKNTYLYTFKKKLTEKDILSFKQDAPGKSSKRDTPKKPSSPKANPKSKSVTERNDFSKNIGILIKSMDIIEGSLNALIKGEGITKNIKIDINLGGLKGEKVSFSRPTQDEINKPITPEDIADITSALKDFFEPIPNINLTSERLTEIAEEILFIVLSVDNAKCLIKLFQSFFPK